MKKSTLSVLFLFMMTYSVSQEGIATIKETNINHGGASLGVHVNQENILKKIFYTLKKR